MKIQSCRFAIQVQDVGSSEPMKFESGTEKDFNLDERRLLECLPECPTPHVLDLIHIASAVLFADRILKRKRRGGPAFWSRKISLSIEVNDPVFWSNLEIYNSLIDVLNFLSGDSWTFHFILRPDEIRNHVKWQRPLLKDIFPEKSRLCLYSGGLDSAAGLAKQLSETGNELVVPILIRHRSDLGEKVKNQLNAMKEIFETELHPVIAPFEMRSPNKLVHSEETSQRSRAFLFATVGAAVADVFNSPCLEIYESGIGAINSPLLTGMEGSQATRSTHPHFLRLMSKLLSMVLQRQFTIVLPFANFTKGEIVSSLAQSHLTEIARTTCTCPSYPIRVVKDGHQQSCGVCAACLFRRVAMFSAGIEEDDSFYQYDILDSKAHIPAKKLRYIKAFLNQIDSLFDTEPGHLPISIRKHLHQTHIVEKTESIQPLADLYHRYKLEWAKMIQKAESVDCKWTRFINLPPQAVL